MLALISWLNLRGILFYSGNSLSRANIIHTGCTLTFSRIRTHSSGIGENVIIRSFVWPKRGWDFLLGQRYFMYFCSKHWVIHHDVLMQSRCRLPSFNLTLPLLFEARRTKHIDACAYPVVCKCVWFCWCKCRFHNSSAPSTVTFLSAEKAQIRLISRIDHLSARSLIFMTLAVWKGAITRESNIITCS